MSSKSRLFYAVAIKFTAPGFHRWKECPDTNPYAGFLRTFHHHSFIFDIRVDVPTPDRSIELLEFRDEVISALNLQFGHSSAKNPTTRLLNFNDMSCETIAAWTAEWVKMWADKKGTPSTAITVTVFEDEGMGGICSLIEG